MSFIIYNILFSGSFDLVEFKSFVKVVNKFREDFTQIDSLIQILCFDTVGYAL